MHEGDLSHFPLARHFAVYIDPDSGSVYPTSHVITTESSNSPSAIFLSVLLRVIGGQTISEKVFRRDIIQNQSITNGYTYLQHNRTFSVSAFNSF